MEISWKSIEGFFPEKLNKKGKILEMPTF